MLRPEIGAPRAATPAVTVIGELQPLLDAPASDIDPKRLEIGSGDETSLFQDDRDLDRPDLPVCQLNRRRRSSCDIGNVFRERVAPRRAKLEPVTAGGMFEPGPDLGKMR